MSAFMTMHATWTKQPPETALNCKGCPMLSTAFMSRTTNALGSRHPNMWNSMEVTAKFVNNYSGVIIKSKNKYIVCPISRWVSRFRFSVNHMNEESFKFFLMNVCESHIPVFC